MYGKFVNIYAHRIEVNQKPIFLRMCLDLIKYEFQLFGF
jgi:hypothetical protein